MNTLEQQFAAQIYTQVKAYGDIYPKDSPERKKYGGMAYKLPILVRTAGLTQALAFVESRGKPPHQALLENLAQVTADCNKDAYLEMSRNAQLQEYIYLTRKTMLALKWYKRFAQSVLDVAPTDESQEGVTA